MPEDPENFILEFKIYSQGKIGLWTSILRFASMTFDCCAYGDHWLAFSFAPNSHNLQLRIVHTSNEHADYLPGVVCNKCNDIKIDAIGDVVNMYTNCVNKGSAPTTNRPARELRVHA